jgi:DNA-binding XRE family transcriptional regulator
MARLFYLMPNRWIKIDKTNRILFHYQTHSKVSLSIFSGINSLSALSADIFSKASLQPCLGIFFTPLIIKTREQKGLTQGELAQKSHVTQQQLSKIENGANCNMLTFIKVSSALGLDLILSA